MRTWHRGLLCSCALGVAFAIAASPVGAEPVQTTLTADANTVGLWRFQEGQGDRSACEGGAPAAVLRGATWVPGRDGFALAMQSGYVMVPDHPSIRPEHGFTAEVWVKLNKSEGDLICKNSVYMIRLGGGMTGLIGVDGRWQTVHGRRTVPLGRWTHLAITYDSATKTGALYIDGALDGKQQFTGVTKGLLSQGGAELRLGLNDWNPLGSEVDGKVAALRISSVARTFEPLYAPARKIAASGNLVPNGNFEMGLLGWRLAGEGDATLLWGREEKGAASGRLCLRTRAGGEKSSDLRSQFPQEALLSRPIPAIPGTRYTLTARVRSDGPGRQADIAAIAAGGSGGRRRGGDDFRQSAELTTEWQQVTHSFNLPNDWTAASLCVRIDPPRDGHFWVDDVRLVAGERENPAALRELVGVGVKAPHTGNLFFAGHGEQAALSIVNGDAKPHRLAVQALIVDWDNQPLPSVSVGTFDVPARGVKEVAFPIDTTRRGTFRLDFEVTAEGQTWRQSAPLKYAVIVPLKGVGDAENSAFGMNTHMEREPTNHLQHSMEVLSQCGVKWIRAWWGWGMVEKERGKFDWTEYDRQLGVVEAAGMRAMPILLRYYPQYEQAWAGALTGIQRPPYKMEEWGAFVGKVIARYKGRVTAWELWNEPTMDNAGFTPEKYAALLRATAPAVREIDPKAKIIGFAGVPLDFLEGTLALGTAPTMNVVSEHSYSQLDLPEINIPKQTAAVRAIMKANGGEKPIWHTEQGLSGDDDGYLPATLSEAEVAALYMRNLLMCRSLGVEKYFWFSAQTSPTYGMTVFYEDYIPRARLVALNACASLLEGTNCRRSYRPSNNAYLFLFARKQPVCVVWNMNAPTRLSLPIRPEGIEALDLMGNPLTVEAAADGLSVTIPAERPTYLCGGSADVAAWEKAMAAAQVADLVPVALAARQANGKLAVTVTNTSRTAQDGVVEVAPAGAAQHFHSLAPGESRVLTFAQSGEIRVRVGDREMREWKVAAP